MKRLELERRLAALGWSFLRHGRKHDVWSDGERQQAVPRHRNINEKLAMAILARAARKGPIHAVSRACVEANGKHWIAAVPVFDAATQGRTRREALDMIADWFEQLRIWKQFPVRVHEW